MAKHIRGNPQVYYTLIEKWEELVKTRVFQSLLSNAAINGSAETKERIFMNEKELK